MARRLTLPDTASAAEPREGGRLHAPSARRNAAAICAAIAEHAPETGRALEIASGTGEHAAAIAACKPGLTWQPTDVDPARLASIDAWAADAGCGNLAPARLLDATEAGWGAAEDPWDLIFASNILHLVSDAEAETLIAEAARALAPGGLLMIYGPFRRPGGFASSGDEAFHASLTAQDPEIGYKSTGDVAAWCARAELVHEAELPMPANNLTHLARKPR
ncbi:SAM-dependent methyltransferase [Rhodovulum iodosum]|uniref:SAM-dependent methyltransferase n=1 Tax=Rhodovulum iodosum TaxID=68291 RepID=A0ABV3XSY9_9RHOB|nr:DUF938 domain-containing protein [Rhodovulum robiginosum]RSK30625.1 DUF938 domain-containing protein [Rhodovulum robiginosum]